MDGRTVIQAKQKNLKTITRANIHKHCDYEYYTCADETVGCLEVIWDDENTKIDKIMEEEYSPSLNNMKKKNLMYIEKVKELAKWKEGETLSLFTKSNVDCCFRVYWNLDKSVYEFTSIMIEPTGYAVLRHYNHYTSDSSTNPSALMIRSDSVYNDKVCDKINKKQ